MSRAKHRRERFAGRLRTALLLGAAALVLAAVVSPAGSGVVG